MDNAQKAIMIGVGLFISIIIISVVLLITILGTDIANESTETLEGLTTSMRQQLALDYNGRVVGRNQVIDAATRYGNMTGITIAVQVGSGTATPVTDAQTALAAATSAGTYTGAVSFVGDVATVTFTAN